MLIRVRLRSRKIEVYLMSNVLEITIDPDIILDESRIKGMPDDIKACLLARMTQSCKKYKCRWTDLEWSVKMIDGNPIIYVKQRWKP